jgi:hypothetical protein
MIDFLQVLRTLDKADRIEPEGIYDLLTIGRKDPSGSFIPGCGLSSSTAVVLIAFVNSTKNPNILDRLLLITKLDEAMVSEGRTALDDFIDWYLTLPEPKNLACILDDIVTSLKESIEVEYNDCTNDFPSI